MIVTQTEFTAGILDPSLPAPEGLQDGTGAPTSKRFDVYRNNVAVSLTDALISAFPVIYKLVGDAFFRAMSGVYLRTHLPDTALMMYYGDKMPQFLKRFGPAQSLPYLPDVARLEIAMRESYHAADAAPVSADALSAIAPDALMGTKLTLSPAIRVIRSSHPIYGLWQANMIADAPKPVKQGENVLITRPAFDPTQHLISDADAEFLAALQAGHALGVAMSKAGPEFDLGAMLGLLLRQGALTEIS